MKPLSFHCPHCHQHIESDPAWSDRDLDCPTCGKSFIILARAKKAMSILSTVIECVVLVFILAITAGIVWVKLQMRAQDLAEDRKHEALLRDINPEKFEEPWQTAHRLSAEAEAEQLKACSNWLGFNRVIDHYVLTSDPAVSNWTGQATVDYINKNGGMERTNLPFKFDLVEHHVCGWVDATKLMRDEYERRMAEIGRQ
jgi:hypothetical protein